MIDDAAIREIVARLARPTASGDHTIERAAILAEGPNCGDIEAWIARMGGQPQAPAPGSRGHRGGRGLHADRADARSALGSTAAPTRYVLPAALLG